MREPSTAGGPPAQRSGRTIGRRAGPDTSAASAAALAVILVLAFWLRVSGLGFGLPAVYNPDEVAILSRALAFATGDLNPHNFLYPTFFFYVLFAWIGGYFVLAWLWGAVPSLDAFQTQFFLDPSSIYLAGRALGVACGVATVWVVWWLGRRLFGTRVALVAALFLAVAPTAVRDAHYIKHDVPATLAIALAILTISRVWPCPNTTPERPGRGASPGPGAPPRVRSAMAGAACGIAFSTHYYAVFLLVPLAMAAWWRASGVEWRERARTAGVAAASAAIVFVALSPFLLVEPATVLRDIVANRQIVVDRSGAGTGRFFASAGAYARMLWLEAAGWPIALLGLIGAWTSWRLSHRVTIWLLAFPALFLVFLGNTVAASRYLNPVLPFLVLLAAIGTSDIAVRLMPRRRVMATVMLAGLAAAPALVESRHVGLFFSQTDTRTLAQQYIEGHVPPGSTILLQPYSVQLVQSRAGLLEALTARLGDPARASTKFALRLRLDPWPSPAFRTVFLGEGGLDADKIYVGYGEFAGGRAAEVFRRLGVDYVVLKRFPVDDPATGPLRRALERQGRLVARFTPYRSRAGSEARLSAPPFLHNTDTPLDPALERPGPIMEIWAIS